MQTRIITTTTTLRNTAGLQMARAGNQAAWNEIIYRYEEWSALQ